MMAFSSLPSYAGRILSRSSTISRSLEALKAPAINQIHRNLARSVWHLSSSTDRAGGNGKSMQHVLDNTKKAVKWPNKPCTCGCGCSGLHTEADKQLSNFLEEEIQIERNSQKNPKIPDVPGFTVAKDGAEVTLTKTGESDEKVEVVFNVNHSVEFEEGADKEGSDEGKESDLPEGQMRSYPDFRVEIQKTGQRTIAVQCSFTTDDDFNQDQEENAEPADDDLFLIDEVYMYDGQASDKTYRVGSEVMQGEMYDHLLALLESRGITSDFVQTLSDLASSYEHSSFINFLEDLQKTIKA